MIIWGQGLIMMLQVTLVLPWPTVLMGQGKNIVFAISTCGVGLLYCAIRFMYIFDFSISWIYGRLFSCGTSKDGESHIVEWNESEGAVKRTYLGLGKRSVGVVQFDTTKNRFLVAGDDFVIKYWDMDNVNLLTVTDAEGSLPVTAKLDLF